MIENNPPRSSFGVSSCGKDFTVTTAPAPNTIAPMAGIIGTRNRKLKTSRYALRTPLNSPPARKAIFSSLDLSFANFTDSIGHNVSATKEETHTAKASVNPNSEKSFPACPGRKEIGTNTAASVAVVEMTANTISLVPTTAAARLRRPWARRRSIFSVTTIASSTTSPVAITKASSVIRLMEKPAR